MCISLVYYYDYITMHSEKNIKRHFTCIELYLIDCTSAFIGGIFLQLRALHVAGFPCKLYKVLCDRSVIKANLFGEQCTFAVVSFLPLEVFSCNFTPPTLHTCITSIASLVAICQ